MHAMKQHSVIMATLQARLLAAYERCCCHLWRWIGREMVPIAQMKADLADPLRTQAYLRLIEKFMAAGIKRMPKPEHDA